MSTITIHPLQITDLEAAFLVSQSAFTALNTLLYTAPLCQESREAFLIPRRESFDKEPHARQFKAIDSDGKLVGFARWSIYEEDQIVEKSVEEIVDGRVSVLIPERRDDVARVMYTTIQEGKREILHTGPAEANRNSNIKQGSVKYRSRVELEALAVHPSYQRQGIARRFLQWGIDEAERLGLDVYLEATEAGRPVYERLGFEALRVLPFGYEGVGESEVTFMILPAKGKSNRVGAEES